MSRFPDGKTFAFTVCDDTDRSTAENVRPVYEFLHELGLRTTKSVWPLATVPEGNIKGASLDDLNYLEFIRELQEWGFEISLHNCRNHDCPRAEAEAGLRRFYELLGHYPRVHCNHLHNRENLYWGPERLRTPLLRFVFNLLTKYRHQGFFQGHLPGSPYYWGDVSRQHIDYVRNLTYPITNLDRINPTMPYADPTKPEVKGWFSSADGGTVELFCERVSEIEQDRLEAEHGVCIVYAHFAFGFVRDGRLHPEFERLMRRLAQKNGWFVPASQLLDFLALNQAPPTIPPAEARRMEWVWMWNRVRRGAQRKFLRHLKRSSAA